MIKIDDYSRFDGYKVGELKNEVLDVLLLLVLMPKFGDEVAEWGLDEECELLVLVFTFNWSVFDVFGNVLLISTIISNKSSFDSFLIFVDKARSEKFLRIIFKANFFISSTCIRSAACKILNKN